MAVDSLIKASTHKKGLERTPGKSDNWVERTGPGGKGGQLPAYIQHIALAIEKDGKTRSNAIAIAIGTCKRWAAGLGKVDANTRAAARKAIAEWTAMKAKAHLTETPVSEIDFEDVELKEAHPALLAPDPRACFRSVMELLEDAPIGFDIGDPVRAVDDFDTLGRSGVVVAEGVAENGAFVYDVDWADGDKSEAVRQYELRNVKDLTESPLALDLDELLEADGEKPGDKKKDKEKDADADDKDLKRKPGESMQAWAARVHPGVTYLEDDDTEQDAAKPGRSIKKGNSGKDVRTIQRTVGAKADGKFGPLTDRKVKEFQAENGLMVDGSVGAQTAMALAGHVDAARTTQPGPLDDHAKAHLRSRRKKPLEEGQDMLNVELDDIELEEAGEFEHLHPRGRGGKFIQKGDIVSVSGVGLARALDPGEGPVGKQGVERMVAKPGGKSQRYVSYHTPFELNHFSGPTAGAGGLMGLPPVDSTPEGEALIARRVNVGHDEASSREMLADLMHRHSGDNLVSALVYNGFGTEKAAAKFAAAIGKASKYHDVTESIELDDVEEAAPFQEQQHPRGRGGGMFIQKGSSGAGVKAVQRAVGVKHPDGTFNDRTMALVKQYQKRHGLLVDGIVGRQTATAIGGHIGKAKKTKPGSLERGQLGAGALAESMVLDDVGEDTVLEGNEIREEAALVLIDHGEELELIESGGAMAVPTGTTFNSDGTIDMVLIRPCHGRGIANAIYEASMLRRDAHVFQGVPMYDNHESPAARAARKHIPRPPSELAGQVRESWFDPNFTTPRDQQMGFGPGAVIGRCMLTEDMEKLVRRMPSAVKTSIRAKHTGLRSTVRNGRRGNLVEGIQNDPDYTSVDLVTAAGAGGEVASLYKEFAG